MRKKTWIIAGCTVAVLIGLLLLSFLTVKIKKQIVIGADIGNVAAQVTRLENWKHWYPHLIGEDRAAGNDLFRPININPSEIIVKEEVDGRRLYHSIFAMPDAYGAKTRLTWIIATSLLTSSKEKLALADEMETGLKNLKKFIEDPKQLYGFPIEIKPISDTLVIGKKLIVAKKDRINTLARTYHELFQYAIENNIPLGDNTPRLANFGLFNKDSIRLMICIPVPRTGKLKNGIIYMKMPQQGRVLVGTYNGAYAHLDQLRKAMEKYIADKELRKAGPDYEKYLSNPVSPRDSLDMNIEICYPIY